MSLIPDPIEAVLAFLKADTDVAAEVGTRVYGSELPHTEIENQPRKAVVIRNAGGPGDESRLALMRPRVDIFHYGATPYEAGEVRRAVYAAMKGLTRGVYNSTLLHDAVLAGGTVDLRLTASDWPVSIDSWIVLVSETAVT